MTRTFKAELLKLRRRRTLIFAALGALAFSLITTIAVVLSAEPAATSGPVRDGRAPTIESLSGSGGIAEPFSIGVSFLGILVLVLFIANFAGEFSQGTFRTLLMRQPRRLGLLAGKLAALLVFAAGALLLAELFSIAAALILAPSQDIATSSWLSVDGLGEAASTYATALLGIGAWATLGASLAVLVRSIPIALGIGIAWSGPFEHITMDVWDAATQWFPGLLLEAWAVGGTTDVSASRAALMLCLYVAIAAVAAGAAFRRRDLAG